MLLVLLTMLVILALALLVAGYVAYPRRGLDVPRVPWLGRILTHPVRALPTLHHTLGDGPRPGADQGRRVAR